MAGTECVEFLQWALPRMGLRWEGFRRVRRQVCKRIGRRVQSLHMSGFDEYRAYVGSHPDEWHILESLCNISISRFVRDRGVFDRLGAEVLPTLAADAVSRGATVIRCWSAGCASGEEPYSVSMLWQLEAGPNFPSLSLNIIATNVDRQLIERARRGRYERSSLREVPATWMKRGFDRDSREYVVRPEFRAMVEFRCENLRTALPTERFELILCRNVAFTYFDHDAQRKALQRLLSVLRSGGGLVIGRKELLPYQASELAPWIPELGIFRRN